jgi:hypothetical protein
MKNYKIFFCVMMASQNLFAQNVGIGTLTPRYPLSFAPVAGQKITLYDDGNAAGNNYGFGIQNGLLQMHTASLFDNIAFGYGKSTSFTERMRLINSGYDGMSLSGRLLLKNGSTDLVGGGAGVWMYKADNSNLLGFMGTQNNQNVGFYGGPAGWGFTYDAINSRVGIGNNNPGAPLSFGAVSGKKISLYPAAAGDIGMAATSDELQIYSDNYNAKLALGYNYQGVFYESFSVNGGQLKVNGTGGAVGEVIRSNGINSSSSWGSATGEMFTNSNVFNLSTYSVLTSGNNVSYDLPGLDQNITLTKISKVLVSMHVSAGSAYCFACGSTTLRFSLSIDNNFNGVFKKTIVIPNQTSLDDDSGFRLYTLPAGTHNFKMSVTHINGPDSNVYNQMASFDDATKMIIIVISQ